MFSNLNFPVPCGIILSLNSTAATQVSFPSRAMAHQHVYLVQDEAFDLPSLKGREREKRGLVAKVVSYVHPRTGELLLSYCTLASLSRPSGNEHTSREKLPECMILGVGHQLDKGGLMSKADDVKWLSLVDSSVGRFEVGLKIPGAT